jgi:hypothetical protein
MEIASHVQEGAGASGLKNGRKLSARPCPVIRGQDHYLLTVIDWRLGKPGATIYGSTGDTGRGQSDSPPGH